MDNYVKLWDCIVLEHYPPDDDSIIISDPLRGRGSRRQEVDLVRDLVVTLNSNSDWELPTTGVSEVEDTTESVSDNQDVNIIKISSDFKIKHFIFASSSSVYGASKKLFQKFFRSIDT